MVCPKSAFLNFQFILFLEFWNRSFDAITRWSPSSWNSFKNFSNEFVRTNKWKHIRLVLIDYHFCFYLKRIIFLLWIWICYLSNWWKLKKLFYRKLKLSLFSLRSTSCTSGLTTFLWSTNLRGSFSGLESTVSLFSLFNTKVPQILRWKYHYKTLAIDNSLAFLVLVLFFNNIF